MICEEAARLSLHCVMARQSHRMLRNISEDVKDASRG